MSDRERLAETATTTKPDPNDENARHHRNGHLLELRECDWRCLVCGHWFDAAIDADLFWCGDDCRHPGEQVEGWEARAKYLGGAE